MTLAVSRAFIMFMIGLDEQTVDTDTSQASGLASRFQESMNVHRETGVSTPVTLSSVFLARLHFSAEEILLYPRRPRRRPRPHAKC